MMRSLVALSLASILSLQACGPGSSSGVYFGKTLTDVKAGQEATFIATRRYTDYNGVLPAMYTERFVRGKDDVSHVDLLTLNGLPREQMTIEQVAKFDRLQKLFEGGQGTYIAKGRDFRVRDFELFYQNYTHVVFDTKAVLTGRPVYVADVKPKLLDRPWYTVWVDQETLITLKYLEFLPSGVLAAEMETLSIEYSPDLTGEVFELPAHSVQQEYSHQQVLSFAPFKLFTPTYLPAGFVHDSTRTSMLASHPVVAFSYTDGVQELFFVQYAEIDSIGLVAEGMVPVKVGMSRYGPAFDAEFAILGTQIHATCKLDPEELMSVIEGLNLVGAP